MGVLPYPVFFGRGQRARSSEPEWIRKSFPCDCLPYGSFWHQQRLRALQRDNFVCQYDGCNETENLDVHHIIPYRMSKNHDLENLVTLCKKHHRIVEVMGFGS